MPKSWLSGSGLPVENSVAYGMPTLGPLTVETPKSWLSGNGLTIDNSVAIRWPTLTQASLRESRIGENWSPIAPWISPITPAIKLDENSWERDSLAFEALVLVSLLQEAGLKHLCRSAWGITEALELKAVDRWSWVAFSARKVIDGLLEQFAPRSPKVVGWVQTEFPDDVNVKGNPTPLGRMRYALKGHMGRGYDPSKLEEISFAYRESQNGVHRPDYESSEIVSYARRLFGLLSWFVALARG
jgi:hypothetical protein